MAATGGPFDADCLIIGGGMVGASVGYHLADLGARVIVLERESQPGSHSTGRSAATFTESYGPPAIRAISAASRAFFDAPPDGFSDHPLLTPRGVMYVASPGQLDRFEAGLMAELQAIGVVDRLGPAEACRLCPALSPRHVALAAYEAGARDVDVHGLLNGFVRGLKSRGGQVVADAEVRSLERIDGGWRVVSRAGDLTGATVVNAAGAWADAVAALAGVPPVGLVPKRRTVVTFDPPEGVDPSQWPLVVDADERFYFKPDAGRILASPADETPSPPCDAQPEELDIAIAVDRVERATSLHVRRIVHSWAGLRSFVADKEPVVGFAPGHAGFFWLAAQGGYGIQTSPMMGRLAATLIVGKPWPDSLRARGVEPADLSPDRFRA